MPSHTHTVLVFQRGGAHQVSRGCPPPTDTLLAAERPKTDEHPARATAEIHSANHDVTECHARHHHPSLKLPVAVRKGCWLRRRYRSLRRPGCIRAGGYDDARHDTDSDDSADDPRPSALGTPRRRRRELWWGTGMVRITGRLGIRSRPVSPGMGGRARRDQRRPVTVAGYLAVAVRPSGFLNLASERLVVTDGADLVVAIDAAATVGAWGIPTVSTFEMESPAQTWKRHTSSSWYCAGEVGHEVRIEELVGEYASRFGECGDGVGVVDDDHDTAVTAEFIG